jgi:hypothetical protein
VNPLESDIAPKILEAIALAKQRSSYLRTATLDSNISVAVRAYYTGQADNYDENVLRLSAILGA